MTIYLSTDQSQFCLLFVKCSPMDVSPLVLDTIPSITPNSYNFGYMVLQKNTQFISQPTSDLHRSKVTYLLVMLGPNNLHCTRYVSPCIASRHVVLSLGQSSHLLQSLPFCPHRPPWTKGTF